MKKILAIVLAVVMLLPVFAVNVFAADDEFKLSTLPDGTAITDAGVNLTGWCPELISYSKPEVKTAFKDALAKENAVIEVVTDVPVGITFQASPIGEMPSDFYPNKTYDVKLSETSADGKITTTFSAKGYVDFVLAQTYGGDVEPDTPMSFDHWCATRIDAGWDNDAGTHRAVTLYSFRVYVPAAETPVDPPVEIKSPLLLEIGNVDSNPQPLIQSASVEAADGGELTLTAELPAAVDLGGSGFIGVKTVSGDVDQVTTLPNGTTVTVTAVKVDGVDCKLDASKTTSKVTDGIFNGHNGVVLLFGWGNINAFADPKPATFKKVEVTVKVELPVEPAASPITIGETAYETLQAAVDAAKEGDTINVNEDVTGPGVVFGKNGKGVNVTIDFGGHTYTVDSAVGDTNPPALGFQTRKESKSVILRNGKLTNSTDSVKFLIQNYTDLTLEGMELVSDNCSYIVSNNNGSLTVKDYVDGETKIPTNITAKAEGAKAFDMYYWPNNGYDTINVTVNTTGTIKGDIEISADGSADFETATSKLALNLQAGTFDGNFAIDKKGLNYEYVAEEPAPVDVDLSKFISDPNVKNETRNTAFESGSTATAEYDAADGTIKFKTDVAGDRITVKLPERIAKNETVTIKLKGKADKKFRTYISPVGNTGAGWNSNQDEQPVNPVDGVFDTEITYTADKDYADYILFTNFKYAGEEFFDVNIVIESIQVIPAAEEPTEEEVKAALYKALAEKTVTIADGTKFTDADVKLFFENPDEQTYDESGNIVVGEKPAPVKAMNTVKGYTFLYVNDDYHAVLTGGLFLPMPHVDDGTGHCCFCRSEMTVELVDVTDAE